MNSYWYSPLGAIAMDGAGEPGKLMVRHQTHANSCALEVRATSPVGENDLQWVEIPLAVPSATITGVNLCYRVDSASPGTTYIFQVRLTQMTTPDSALVVLDERTRLSSSTPTCLLSKAHVEVKGSITLALRMVFGNTADRIILGGIELQTE
jgi:hypothetical protein